MPESISEIITCHFLRYPKMQIQDVYKLLYQAAMGIEHLLQDPTPVLALLQQELTTVAPDSSGEMAESISPEMVRLHLAPFKARRGNPAQLIHGMFQSARNFAPSTARVEAYWKILVRLADEKIIPVAAIDLAAFFEIQRRAGLPAVHHSAIFRENYRPAYRIILKKYVTELQLADSGGNP